MKNFLFVAFVLYPFLQSCNSSSTSVSTASQDTSAALSADSVRAIAKEAYIYGFPMVDAYRIEYAYFIDRKSPEFKAPYNQLANFPRVFTAADTVVQTPNSDTPYGFAGLDLRSEPIVLTVPVIDKSRYFSIQLIDAYTFNFDYIGSRATGNNGGSFLIVGPEWKGDIPKGIAKVIHSETDLILALYRTQLFNPGDLDNVKKIQAKYKVQTLSAFLGQPAPSAQAAISFIPALSPTEERSSLEFFNVLNFLLKFCPTDSSETALMARFAKIGVGAGMTFDTAKLTPETAAALKAGIADAWQEFADFKKNDFETGKVTASAVFGTREYLKNNYLYRMGAAVLGIFGNSSVEAMYPAYTSDANSQPLNGANKYTLHFAAGQLPPVNAFWSLTMYKMPSSLLVANSLNRYLLNSPMLPKFKKDPDGGITFYIQNASPGADKESNWLPAPSGPFAIYMRLYWPKPDALDGKWKRPPILHV